MTVKLRMLALSVVLGIVHIVAAVLCRELSARLPVDGRPQGRGVEPLQSLAGHLDRALRNFAKTFPLFTAVVLAAHVSDTHGTLTEWGARLYF